MWPTSGMQPTWHKVSNMSWPIPCAKPPAAGQHTNTTKAEWPSNISRYMNPDNTLPPSETADSSVPPSEPQKPLVTIATVTYNAAETLERTLSSVASQDYPRIEHLIIDGCSTDSTLSVVQQYVAENTRTSHPHHIRLISEPDNGLYDAMNKALGNASGLRWSHGRAGKRVIRAILPFSMERPIWWMPRDVSCVSVV